MIPHIAEWGYFIFLSTKSWLGSFSSLWMTLSVSCRPLSGSHFPTRCGAPKHLSYKVWGGALLNMHKASWQREQMAPSDKTLWIKEANKRQWKIDWDKRCTFFPGTSVDERSGGDCLYSCGSGPPQGAEPGTAVTAFPFRRFIVL